MLDIGTSEARLMLPQAEYKDWTAHHPFINPSRKDSWCLDIGWLNNFTLNNTRDLINIPMKRLGHGSNIITAEFNIQILSFSKFWTSSLQIPQFDSSEYSRYQQLVSSYGNPGLYHEDLANSPGRFNVTLGLANRMWYRIYYLGWASTKKEIWRVAWEKTGTALALAKPSLWSGRTRP